MGRRLMIVNLWRDRRYGRNLSWIVGRWGCRWDHWNGREHGHRFGKLVRLEVTIRFWVDLFDLMLHWRIQAWFFVIILAFFFVQRKWIWHWMICAFAMILAWCSWALARFKFRTFLDCAHDPCCDAEFALVWFSDEAKSMQIWLFLRLKGFIG